MTLNELKCAIELWAEEKGETKPNCLEEFLTRQNSEKN